MKAFVKEPKKKQRYRHSEGKRWIEVRVKNPYQLFDARDPAPFRERDLDDDFVEYILSSIREFSFSTPFKIIVYVEETETKDLSKNAIQEAIHSYFAYKVDLQKKDLKTFMKRAQFFLMIGILVLVSCVGIAQSLPLSTQPGPLGILREGIVIFGWVSIWKPIELILFDWYPHYEKLRIYRKMLETSIDIHFS